MCLGTEDASLVSDRKVMQKKKSLSLLFFCIGY